MVVTPSALGGVQAAPAVLVRHPDPAAQWAVTISPLHLASESVIEARCSCGFNAGTYTGDLAMYRAGRDVERHVQAEHTVLL